MLDQPQSWDTNRVNPFIQATEALTLAGVGALCYGLAEAQAFSVRHSTLQDPNFTFDELRILHLSDLHITPAQTRKINWVKSLSELKPDLTVVTGDFLAHVQAVPAVIEALDTLLDGPGMFVFGSNDYFAPEFKNPMMYFNKSREINPQGVGLPTEELRAELTAAGWIDLNNRHEFTTVHGVAIDARGTDDPHIHKDNYSTIAGPYRADALRLGVTHAPYLRVLNQFVADDTQVILAGHTHGGQVCIPFYGALVTNCDLPAKLAKGSSEISYQGKFSTLHVSAGVGTSPFTPIRIACRPEATLLTLKK